MTSQFWLICLTGLLVACAAEEPASTKMKKEIAAGRQGAEATARSAPITYKEAIDSRKFGLAPNALVDGQTIERILTSQVPGRDDRQLCSSCHNQADPQGGYGVPVAKNAANIGMKPTDLVGLHTWAGRGGWAERFVKNPTKPQNLKMIIQAWIDSGCR